MTCPCEREQAPAATGADTSKIGDATWTAVSKDAAARNYGTSDSDLESYSEAAGAAGAVAACAAYGLAAAAPVCAAIGGAVGKAVGNAVTSLGHALFGQASQPDAGDVFNPVADRIVAGLVLLSLDEPHTRAAVHALGEQGIRILAGRQADGSATDAHWIEIASMWSALANQFGVANSSRRSGTEIQWFYESGPKAGRIRGSVASLYGNGPDDRADIAAAMTAATSEAAARIEAAKHPLVYRGGTLDNGPASSGSGAVVAVGAALGLAALAWAVLA